MTSLLKIENSGKNNNLITSNGKRYYICSKTKKAGITGYFL